MILISKVTMEVLLENYGTSLKGDKGSLAGELWYFSQRWQGKSCERIMVLISKVPREVLLENYGTSLKGAKGSLAREL